MTESRRAMRAGFRPRPAESDPDEVPELSDEWFEAAEFSIGDRIIRPGRPPIAFPKVQVTLRLSPEVIAEFKAGGPGWQTRIDDTLKRVVRRRIAAAARKRAAKAPAKGARKTPSRRAPGNSLPRKRGRVGEGA